jgi:hypothetical protein
MSIKHELGHTPLFLLPTELRQLTEFSRRREQCQRLHEMGIPFEVGRNGRPIVLREVIQARFGAATTKTGQQTRPNLEALRELTHG